MKFKEVVLIIGLLAVGTLIYMVTPKQDTNINVKLEQKEAAKVAVKYLQMYNTVCTKENYSKYLEEFKTMCTEDFYNRTYIQSNVSEGGLAEDMLGYSMDIDTTVCQINEAGTGFKVMVYEVETYGNYKYPYTIIVDLTKDNKIDDFQKISHRFN